MIVKLVRVLFIGLVAIMLMVCSILFIGYAHEKKPLIVIGNTGKMEGVYANIRPLSIFPFILPGKKEIECLFEVYFGYSSVDYGEDCGEFLSNLSVYFLGRNNKSFAEFYFKGVIIQENTKLTGIVWIEKKELREIEALYYRFSESEQYRLFNNINYKKISKIREDEKKKLRQEKEYSAREKQLENSSKRYLNKLNDFQVGTQENKGYIFQK